MFLLCEGGKPMLIHCFCIEKLYMYMAYCFYHYMENRHRKLKFVWIYIRLRQSWLLLCFVWMSFQNIGWTGIEHKPYISESEGEKC